MVNEGHHIGGGHVNLLLVNGGCDIEEGHVIVVLSAK